MKKYSSFISTTLALIALASSHQIATAMDGSGLGKAYEAFCMIGGMTGGGLIGRAVYKHNIKDRIKQHEHRIQEKREYLAKIEQEISDVQKHLSINSMLVHRLSQAQPFNGQQVLSDNKARIDQFLGTDPCQISPIIQTKKTEVQTVRTEIACLQAKLAADRAQYETRMVCLSAHNHNGHALVFMGGAWGILLGLALQQALPYLLN